MESMIFVYSNEKYEVRRGEDHSAQARAEGRLIDDDVIFALGFLLYTYYVLLNNTSVFLYCHHGEGSSGGNSNALLFFI